ncbi:M24 family metallopeptidase [Jannaschia formosa]|uniref:M24 family metallopeptidase n=1 Tax=Jannaschia formosa TaxID=2259592 RepID=UPI000E1B5AA6|nr:Xaa-Pro peptidase family protein [Jannaschia formosa]TFL16316.1 aminopeptidase P family protein [Jannaschia formosa]
MSATTQDRIARLRDRMAATGCDLVAVGPTSHMRWLAGADPHGDERPVMLLVSQTHAGFLMPALNADSVRQATDLPFETWADADGPAAALERLRGTCALPADPMVAVDEAMRADFALLLLDAMGGPRRSFCDGTVGWLRARKEPEEIDRLRASAALNDRAMAAGFACLREGIAESEVADAIRAVYAEAGATPAFTIVGFGANGAFPHHHTGATRLAPETAVLIDTGCVLDGYPSDMTRCAWFGRDPSPEFARVAETVRRATEAGIAAARPGARARDVDAAARGVIEAAGYGPRFVHRTGHGLGVDIHEPPWITATSEDELAPGMVFSVEPGIYLPGAFGIRIEDIVVLGRDGAEPLGHYDRVPAVIG